MGCAASQTRDPTKLSDNQIWELFLARAHNAGYTNTALMKVSDPKKRQEIVTGLFFTDADSLRVVASWGKLSKDADDDDKNDVKCRTELPQKVSLEERRVRLDEIEKRTILYKYTIPDAPIPLPPNPEGLPEPERDGAEHALNIFGTNIKTRLELDFNATVDFIHDIFKNEEDPFKDWRDLYRTTELPAVAKQDKDGNELWRTDKDFGYQRLNGVNPTLIRRLEGSFPAKFPVTDEIVKDVIPEGVTLAELIEQKKIMWVDYELLDGLPAPKENNITAPMGAFYFNDDGDLMPLAVQLNQIPGPENPIFTPKNCSPNCWLVVKMHMQVADEFQHEVSSHFLATHALMELVYVAMKRNMSDHHPISHLLGPHFWFTMALNWSARRDLISPGGAVPRLMVGGYDGLVHLLSRAWDSWTFTRFDIPTRFKARGVDNPKDCPKNYFRDDSLQLWNILLQYVLDMVNGIYGSDQDIADDNELQAWVKEMTHPMMLGMKGLPVNYETNQMETRQQLILFCTELIFNVTAGHSAVNNGQWDYFGFIPNNPGKLHKPCPTSLEVDFTLCEVAAMLPGYTDATDQITVVKALSSPATQILGQYPENFFDGRPELQPFIVNLKKELASMSEEVKQRNANLVAKGEQAYPYLDPDQIAQSIAV